MSELDDMKQIDQNAKSRKFKGSPELPGVKPVGSGAGSYNATFDQSKGSQNQSSSMAEEDIHTGLDLLQGNTIRYND